MLIHNDELNFSKPPAAVKEIMARRTRAAVEVSPFVAATSPRSRDGCMRCVTCVRPATVCFALSDALHASVQERHAWIHSCDAESDDEPAP